MRPRDVNNAIRTMMAQIATGIDNSEFGGVPQFHPATAAGPATLDFAEDTDNGTNKIVLSAPSSIASDKTATFQDITGTLYITGGQDVSLADGGTGASLTDPNADRIMFWDDSAGAVTWLAPNTGLAISGTNLNLSFLGIEALTDPNADRVAFWDDSAGAFAWLTMGTNLTITGTTLDAAGGSGQPVPTGSSLAVGSLAFCCYVSTTAVTAGNTTSGSNLRLAIADSIGLGQKLNSGGATQTGTWRNDSGVTQDSDGSIAFGYWTRTA
jgi:hypothetical protein